jgi:membrane associated rhomboid family serine protease
LIIPWQVDVPQERLPFVNWLFIAAAIVVFLWEVPQIEAYYKEIHKKEIEINQKQIEIFLKKNNDSNYTDPNYIESEFKKIKNPLNEYMLTGWTDKGMFTHMWLHGGWIHLIGNMLFLWIFGNAVCAKIGNIIYAPIYIILGLSAAITYSLFSNQPMLGASGAINGIVGMYLVFFPTNSITCYWSLTMVYWKEFETSSYVMILLWLVYDIIGAVLGGSNVAYFAHFGGFATGFVIAIILLKTKFITMTRYEKSLLDIFSEMRSKPASRESYSDPILAQEYSTSDKNQATEKTPAETKQIPQSTLSADDFFMQPQSYTEPLPAQPKTPANDGFIRFYCTCGKRIKVPAQHAGKRGKCPQCKQPINIPKIN